MKFFYTISFCIFNLIAFSQTKAWTKVERTTLYNNCMNVMKAYDTPSAEQKEKISLCCLGEITKKYSKSAFDELLDVEAKHVMDDFIKQCAKNLSIDIYWRQGPDPSSVNSDEIEL